MLFNNVHNVSDYKADLIFERILDKKCGGN